MVTQAVFFDLYNTLVRFYPDREQIQQGALRAVGVEASAARLREAYKVADAFWARESFRMRDGSGTEGRNHFFTDYEQVLLTAAGIQVAPDVALEVFLHVLQSGSRFVLFDDVVPTLQSLKRRGLAIGIITNFEGDLYALSRELQIEAYVDVAVSTRDVGADKPDPAIFRAALQQVGAPPEAAVHVGDQYASDVQGARNAGIRPVLLDRENAHPDVTDCPRITTLGELLAYV